MRTIGVITKIDIMDAGTNAVSMLKGDDIPLKLGYVGVKLRNQHDIETMKPMKQSLADEKKWFQEHRQYSKLAPGMVGVPALIDKLTKILFRKIRHFLPEIKKEIGVRTRDVSGRL